MSGHVQLARLWRQAFHDLAVAPVVRIFALGLLPQLLLLACSGVPSEIVFHGIVMRRVAEILGGSIVGAVQVALGIHFLRRRGLTWQTLLVDFPRALVACLALVVISEAGSMVGRWPALGGSVRPLLQALALSISLYASCRLLLWVPAIIDGPRSISEGARLSVARTRGRLWQMLGALLGLGVPTVLIGVGFAGHPVLRVAAWSVAAPVMVLFYCHLFIAQDQEDVRNV